MNDSASAPVAAAPESAAGEDGDAGQPASSTRRQRVFGYGLLALLAYLPPLLAAPGKLSAEPKNYLYLDPGRLLERAPYMWDPSIGLGTVTHQNIGFLFPLGPFYWVFDRLGTPDWVAQRLWLGSLLFLAAVGMLFLYRTLGQRGPGMVVGALAYMLTPYVLEYTTKFSDIVLPWVALPWMIAIVALALRKGGWKYPAIFAIVVQLVGSVNATALLLAGIAPALWIPYAVWVAREVDWRRALATTARIAVLTLFASLWWIAGLWAQGSYGIDVLRYTETFKTVSISSTATETLRGLGYWYFYGKDRVALWNEVSGSYTQQLLIIAGSFLIPILAVLSAVVIRWRHRAYFIAITVIGVALAVGAYPYDDSTVFGGLFKSFAEGSSAGLALRSSSRATPLVVLGLATLLGVGVNAVVRRLRERGRLRLGLGVAGIVGALVIVSYAPIWNGDFYSSSLLRGDIPSYWRDAIAALDRQPHDTRILEIPGTDFTNYRWGGTVEPITPGLTDRPYVARELVPWGSPPAADLVDALDRALQERVLEPESLPAVARLLAAGDVVVRNDLEVDRYDLVRPRELWALLHPRPDGLGPPQRFGRSNMAPLHLPQHDDRSLGLAPDARAGAPVTVYPVVDPKTVVRSAATEHQLLVSGDGEGLVDAGAVGLLDTDGAILYSGTYAAEPAKLRGIVAADDGATLLVTDSNRRRAQRWTGLSMIFGYTERAGEHALRTDTADSRLVVFPDAGDDARTVVEQHGATVAATGYGTADSYRPEDRPSRALDGDVTTAWRTAGKRPAIGERIVIDLDEAITTDHLRLVQPLDGPRERFITRATVQFDGGDPVTVDLGPESRTADGQTVSFPSRTFDHLSVTIDDTNVGDRTGLGIDNPVGFAEIGMHDEHVPDVPVGAHDVRVDEVVRLPVDLVETAGATSAQRQLVYLLDRQRTTHQSPRLGDDEPALVRELRVPTDRSFDLRGTARLSTGAPDEIIDHLLGLRPAVEGGVTARSSGRLPGSVEARASSALDGAPGTAWTTPFGDSTGAPIGAWIDVAVPAPVTVDHLDLQVVADGRHSVPTQLRIDAGGESRVVDVPAVRDGNHKGATRSVPVTFPALTGDDFRVTVTGVRPVSTFDAQTELPVVTPVAIAELGIPGVAPGTFARDVESGCFTELLTVDGTPVNVRVVGDTATAVNLRALDLQRCDTTAGLPLTAGDHELRAADGRQTGIDIDGVTLASAAGGAPAPLGPGGTVAPAPRVATPKVRVLDDGRTSLHVRITGATRPSWLVLGQSQNAGWEATVDGHDIGGSTLVDGYANGWRITPRRDGGPIDVQLTWTPQRTVWLALGISGLTLLVCLALALGLRLRRRRDATTPARAAAAAGARAAPDGSGELDVVRADDEPLGRTATIVGTVAVTLVAAGLSRWWVGVLVGLAFLLGALRPRRRWIGALGAPLAVAIAGGYVLVQQWRNDYGQVLEWPTFFARVHWLAWLAVLLLAADALLEVLRRRRSAP